MVARAGDARQPLASVVVPAHDEASVIDRCLQLMLDGAAPGELDIIVVANACRDRTAAVAIRRGVRVVETPIPGKVNALLLGDAECRVFPRIYLDADVELDVRSIRALVESLTEPGVLACAPESILDLSDVGPVVRRVHRVSDRLVAPRRALAGVGAYAMNERGHSRAFPLPDVIADDEWVHRSFAPAERRVVAEACTTVYPARSLRTHLRRRVRVRLGNEQLERMGFPAAEGKLGLAALRGLLRSRAVTTLDAACYLAVAVVERVLVRIWYRSGAPVSWATDAGSRCG